MSESDEQREKRILAGARYEATSSVRIAILESLAKRMPDALSPETQALLGELYERSQQFASEMGTTRIRRRRM